MVLKNIKVSEETWWKLNKIKVDKKLKKLGNVIDLLVSEQEKKKK